ASNYGNWWRIIFSDRVGYIHKNKVANYGITETYYDISIEEVVEIQRTASPQTDKEYRTYVPKNSIDKNNRVNTNILNVKGGPSSNYWTVGVLKKGDAVEIINELNEWYEIEYTKFH